MKKAIWSVAAVGLLAAAACGKADQSANTAGAAPAASLEPAFNAGLCQSGLDAHKGANATLPPGGCVISPGKTFAMVMLNSGELTVAPIDSSGKLGATSWSTHTHATAPGSSATAFQEDGNLVIYDQPGNKPTWSSASAGPLEPYHLALSDAGELTTTRVSNGKVFWSSKTGTNGEAIGLKPAAAAKPANATT